jgi:NADPH:quinone reductase-like Zn-dependent oxidoreductase
VLISLSKTAAPRRWRGIISQVGYLGKQNPQDLEGLLAKLIDKTATLRYYVCVCSFGAWTDLQYEGASMLARGWNWSSSTEWCVNQMSFSEIVDKTFPFKKAAEAFEYLWSGKHVGKVVIEIP